MSRWTDRSQENIKWAKKNLVDLENWNHMLAAWAFDCQDLPKWRKERKLSGRPSRDVAAFYGATEFPAEVAREEGVSTQTIIWYGTYVVTRKTARHEPT